MTNIDALYASWNLLGEVDVLFNCSRLPTISAANQGEYGRLDKGPELERLMNDITRLRVDIKLNPMKRNRVRDLRQLTHQSAVDDLKTVTEDLLGMFEDLVIDEALLEGGVSLVEKRTSNLEAGSGLSQLFPKLCSLKAELQECSRGTTTGDDTDFPQFEVDSETDSSTRHSQWQRDRALDRIQFPTDSKSIGSCRRTAEKFGQVFDRVFSKNHGKWKSQDQARNFKDTDVAIVKSAHEFSTSCTSLFTHMTKDTVCGKMHEAKVHLSGFEKQQLNVILKKCHGPEWIPACFTRSVDGTTPLVSSRICNLEPASISQLPMIHIGYNESTMWKILRTDESLVTRKPENIKVLDRQRLNSTSRKLLEVLLACSLLQLYGSPWIQAQRWQWKNIHLHEYPNDENPLHQVQPHLLCILSEKAGAANDIDNETVAAFGVLLMELESNEMADWEDVEDDLEFGAPSDQLRLGMALEMWIGHVCDGYRAIAQACHDFPSLVNEVECDMLGPQLKRMAVICNCILRPLYNLLLTDHSDTAALFEGTSGLLRSLHTPINITSSKAAKQVLFDDFEAENLPVEDRYTRRFWEDMEPFKNRIGTLMECPNHAKIRIAVIDSGVNESDPMIRGAIRSGRIAELKSWVGDSGQYLAGQKDQASYHDIYGHGTHITRLLLEAAPEAKIYVAKICHKKTINDEFMSGIAKAINWAVEECDVHIISMSFGFEEHNDEIDEAIDNAVKKDKLLFAAASNNGALSTGPSRPARRSDVMCIYASDGLGNRGPMNPPVDKNEALFHFSTLGVAMPFKWQNKEVWKSGTSFATPIAAGFAASVLYFVESVDYTWTTTKFRRRVLYQKYGMEAVFKAMSVSVGDMRFVHPIHLWENDRSDEEVAKLIETIIQDL